MFDRRPVFLGVDEEMHLLPAQVAPNSPIDRSALISGCLEDLEIDVSGGAGMLVPELVALTLVCRLQSST